MKIEVEIPDGQTVGTAKIVSGAPPVQPPIQPPVTPPGLVPAPWDPKVMLSVTMLNPLQVNSGNHTFVPTSAFIQCTQIHGNFTNAGFSAPPRAPNGCWACLGSQPGLSDLMGWVAGPDNVNLMRGTPGGDQGFMSMVLDPKHAPPGTQCYYSALAYGT